MKNYLIAPSILAANFARLGEEVDAVLMEQAQKVTDMWGLQEIPG